MVKQFGAKGFADGFGVGGERNGLGFAVQFDRKGTEKRTLEILRGNAIVIQGASVESVVKTTVEVKLKIRAYINAHFKGSDFQSNNNRKVANASAQDTFYNDIAEKGQYTGLVYSKFGMRSPGRGFVDYLLLHVRGGTLRPSRGNWLRIANMEVTGMMGLNAQSGFFETSQSNIFFTNSADGRKLFQLRRYKKGSLSGKAGKTELIATLLKQVAFPARLTGIDEIARSRADLFDKNFKAAFDARTVGA